jgi:hypothetical protein
MALKRLALTRGDSQTYPITFKTAAGVVYDISNWTVYFTLKENTDLPDSAASLQKVLVSGTNATMGFGTFGTSGIATISLYPSDTVNLTPKEYDFDIKVRTAVADATAQVFTVLKGKFDLEYNVTRASTAGTSG